MLLRRVVETLPRFTYLFGAEAALHDGIAQVLRGAGVEFEREHVAGPKDRFDFLLPGGIVIEAKVAGSMPEALRQCLRYVERTDVSAVVLVASRAWAKGSHTRSFSGKSIHIVHLRGAAF